MTSDASAKLMKWPSLHGERINPKDGAGPYSVMQGSLRECIENLRSKPAATHCLYEVHLNDGSILSADDAMARLQLQEGQPPPEEDYGGGDFVSVQEQPSTDDDKPLD